jgi:hypothetical protein
MIFIHDGIYKICDGGSGANIQIHLCQDRNSFSHIHRHKAASRERQKLAD